MLRLLNFSTPSVTNGQIWHQSCRDGKLVVNEYTPLNIFFFASRFHLLLHRFLSHVFLLRFSTDNAIKNRWNSTLNRLLKRAISEREKQGLPPPTTLEEKIEAIQQRMVMSKGGIMMPGGSGNGSDTASRPDPAASNVRRRRRQKRTSNYGAGDFLDDSEDDDTFDALHSMHGTTQYYQEHVANTYAATSGSGQGTFQHGSGDYGEYTDGDSQITPSIQDVRPKRRGPGRPRNSELAAMSAASATGTEADMDSDVTAEESTVDEEGGLGGTGATPGRSRRGRRSTMFPGGYAAMEEGIVYAQDAAVAATTSRTAAPEQPVKRGRGRPRGSGKDRANVSTRSVEYMYTEDGTIIEEDDPSYYYSAGGTQDVSLDTSQNSAVYPGAQDQMAPPVVKRGRGRPRTRNLDKSADGVYAPNAGAGYGRIASSASGFNTSANDPNASSDPLVAFARAAEIIGSEFSPSSGITPMTEIGSRASRIRKPSTRMLESGKAESIYGSTHLSEANSSNAMMHDLDSSSSSIQDTSGLSVGGKIGYTEPHNMHNRGVIEDLRSANSPAATPSPRARGKGLDYPLSSARVGYQQNGLDGVGGAISGAHLLDSPFLTPLGRKRSRQLVVDQPQSPIGMVTPGNRGLGITPRRIPAASSNDMSNTLGMSASSEIMGILAAESLLQLQSPLQNNRHSRTETDKSGSQHDQGPIDDDFDIPETSSDSNPNNPSSMLYSNEPEFSNAFTPAPSSHSNYKHPNSSGPWSGSSEAAADVLALTKREGLGVWSNGKVDEGDPGSQSGLSKRRAEQMSNLSVSKFAIPSTEKKPTGTGARSSESPSHTQDSKRMTISSPLRSEVNFRDTEQDPSYQSPQARPSLEEKLYSNPGDDEYSSEMPNSSYGDAETIKDGLLALASSPPLGTRVRDTEGADGMAYESAKVLTFFEGEEKPNMITEDSSASKNDNDPLATPFVHASPFSFHPGTEQKSARTIGVTPVALKSAFAKLDANYPGGIYTPSKPIQRELFRPDFANGGPHDPGNPSTGGVRDATEALNYSESNLERSSSTIHSHSSASTRSSHNTLAHTSRSTSHSHIEMSPPPRESKRMSTSFTPLGLNFGLNELSPYTAAGLITDTGGKVKSQSASKLSSRYESIMPQTLSYDIANDEIGSPRHGEKSYHEQTPMKKSSSSNVGESDTMSPPRVYSVLQTPNTKLRRGSKNDRTANPSRGSVADDGEGENGMVTPVKSRKNSDAMLLQQADANVSHSDLFLSPILSHSQNASNSFHVYSQSHIPDSASRNAIPETLEQPVFEPQSESHTKALANSNITTPRKGSSRGQIVLHTPPTLQDFPPTSVVSPPQYSSSEPKSTAEATRSSARGGRAVRRGQGNEDHHSTVLHAGNQKSDVTGDAASTGDDVTDSRTTVAETPVSDDKKGAGQAASRDPMNEVSIFSPITPSSPTQNIEILAPSSPTYNVDNKQISSLDNAKDVHHQLSSVPLNSDLASPTSPPLHTPNADAALAHAITEDPMGHTTDTKNDVDVEMN